MSLCSMRKATVQNFEVMFEKNVGNRKIHFQDLRRTVDNHITGAHWAGSRTICHYHELLYEKKYRLHFQHFLCVEKLE
jgi:hypothetical protein